VPVRLEQGGFFVRPWRRLVSIALPLLGACALATATPLAAAPVPAAAAGGATLTVASDNAISTLDPITSASDEVQYLANVYQGLVYAAPPGSRQPYQPQLAVSWTHSQDGKTWTFELRRGVHFQDGSLMTAQDVVASLKLDFPQAGLLWQGVAALRATGPYTVVFTMKYPMNVAAMLTAEYNAWIVGPKALKEPESWFDAGHSDGTGPYEISRYQSSQSLVLTAMRNYWGGWKGAHYTTVVNDLVTDPSVQQELVEGGQAQLANGIPETSLASVKADPNLNVVVAPSNDYYIAYYNTKVKPLTSQTVRQALDYAIPYQAIIAVATGGYGRQMQGPLPYGVYPHDNALPQYHTDLAKARELLAKAGYPHGGFTLSMTCTTDIPECSLFAPLMKENFAKIGVGLTIRTVSSDEGLAVATGKPSKAQDIFILEDWPEYVDDWIDLYYNYGCYQPIQWNLSYACNAPLNAMFNQANALQVTNPAKAQALYDRYQQGLLTFSPVAFLYDDRNVFVMAKTVGGFVNTPEYPAVVFYYDLHPQA